MNLNEGVFDRFKRQRVLKAIIKKRTAQRDTADTQSDQLGLSMNDYLNHRDASRLADDSIEKNKERLAGRRGRDYTDRMNISVEKWFKKEKNKDKKKKKKNMQNEEVVAEGKQLDRLKKLGIIAGMTAFGGGIGLARHNQYNTYTDKTGTRIVDGSAIPAGVSGAGGGALIGSLMARDMVASSKRNRDLKKHLKKSKETRDMKNEEYTQVLEQMILTLTGMKLEELHEAVVGQLSEDYQTPARNAQMQDKYDRAEGKFFNNLSSDKLLRKVREIDNKNNAEQQSPRLYGKNGVQIKQTKKKQVRIGQPGGKQGGYQG